MSKIVYNRIIRNQVDLILFEEGSFSPLTWLLREGHLDYADYRMWKKGEVDYLDSCFITSASNILSDLELVKSYSSVLKLECFQLTYLSSGGQQLSFSRCPENELIYSTVFEPADNRVQMDLFFDSSSACTENDLITAIINNRNEDITKLLARLEGIDFAKYHRFKALLSIQNKFKSSSESGDWKRQLLEDQLIPLAFELLGRIGHDFLTPLWQIISTDISGQRFDPGDPRNHLSYTAFKSFQWESVLSSVLGEKDWLKQPLLLFRYAEACFKLQNELEGLEKWFMLFMIYSAEAEQDIDKTCNRLLLADWQFFRELDPELDTLFFPAWMLLNKPALAKHAFVFDTECDGVKSFHLISQLLTCAEGGLDEAAIQLRAELKLKNPSLFVHLMKAAEDGKRV